MPTIPNFQPQPSSLGRQASAADFGAEAGGALQGAGSLANELGQASAHIYLAQQDAKMRRLETDYAVGVDQTAFDLENDPKIDIDTHEAIYEKASKTALDEASKQLPVGFQQEFADRTKEITARGRLRVRANVIAKRVELGRAETVAANDAAANLIGRSADSRDRELLRTKQLEGLDASLRSGLITPAQHGALAKELDAKSLDALALVGKNVHPAATLEDLRQRRNGFERMDEGRRQELIEQLDHEIKQQERLAKNEEIEARIRAQQAKAEIQEKTARQGMSLVIDGKLTTDWIRQNLPTLSKTDADYFLTETRRPQGSRVPDPQEYYRLRSLQFDHPIQFALETIDPSKVGAAKWDLLKQAQAQARKGLPVPVGDFNAELNRKIKGAPGIDDNERGELFRLGEAGLEDWVRSNGKQPGPKERASIIDELFMSHVVHKPGIFGFFRDTSVLPNTIPLRIAGVPDDAVNPIIDALKRRGMAINPQSILEIYQQAQARQAKP